MDERVIYVHKVESQRKELPSEVCYLTNISSALHVPQENDPNRGLTLASPVAPMAKSSCFSCERFLLAQYFIICTDKNRRYAERGN